MVHKTVPAIANQFATNSIRLQEESVMPDNLPIPAVGNNMLKFDGNDSTG
jgi:hypothetical protein